MQLQALKKLVGLPTDIIGYFDNNCCENSCCACGGGRMSNIVWLTNFGVLNKLTVDNKDDRIMEITLDIVHGAYWRPLQRYFWQWTGVSGIPFNVKQKPLLPYANYFTRLPSAGEIFCRRCQCKHFVKRSFNDCLVGYDPDLWAMATCDYPTDYPQSSHAMTWTVGEQVRNLFIDPTIWGAPPLTVYALRNLPPVGEVKIAISRSEGEWSSVDEVSVLDLAQLNVDLVAFGYNGLQADDIVYLGDVIHKAGFVVRNGQILERPRPLPTYPGKWVGYMTPGNIRMHIEIPDTAQCAYLVDFRRL